MLLLSFDFFFIFFLNHFFHRVVERLDWVPFIFSSWANWGRYIRLLRNKDTASFPELKVITFTKMKQKFDKGMWWIVDIVTYANWWWYDPISSAFNQKLYLYFVVAFSFYTFHHFISMFYAWVWGRNILSTYIRVYNDVRNGDFKRNFGENVGAWLSYLLQNLYLMRVVVLLQCILSFPILNLIHGVEV